VAEVAWIDAWLGCWVGRFNVHAAAGERVFEADEEGKTAFSFWRFGEEFGLVGTG